MRTKLRILAEMTLPEWLFLLQLVALSLVLKAGLRLTSLPCLTGRLIRGARYPWLRHFPLFHHWIGSTRLATLADRAARITSGQGRCLQRSLLLLWLLHVRDEAAELVVGVTKQEGALHGHAWIENHGRLVADKPEITSRFSTLLRF